MVLFVAALAVAFTLGLLTVARMVADQAPACPAGAIEYCTVQR